jgi:hypothetical protein
MLSPIHVAAGAGMGATAGYDPWLETGPDALARKQGQFARSPARFHSAFQALKSRSDSENFPMFLRPTFSMLAL